MLSPEVKAKIEKYFKKDDGPLGKLFMDKLPLHNPSSLLFLHWGCASSTFPSAAKSKAMFAHFGCPRVMQEHPSRYYCPSVSTIQPALASAAKALNPIPSITGATPDTSTRLKSLQSKPVGGMLCVVNSLGASNSDSFVTIVTAPTLAPVGTIDASPGIPLSDLWTESVSSLLELDDINHCPLMGGMGSYSRTNLTTLRPTPELLVAAEPWFFPFGESAAETVTSNHRWVYRAIFLPEVCDPPTGVFWPTSISYSTFKDTLVCLARVTPTFLSVVEALDSQLLSWFEKVAADPKAFALRGIPYRRIKDTMFPDLLTGEYPDSVVSPVDLSPIVELLNGFVWRHTCDEILATTNYSDCRGPFSTFLEYGAGAITSQSYFGAAINPVCCPSFGNHLIVAGGWPTQPDPFSRGALPGLISHRVSSHVVININIHLPTPPSGLLLCTKNEASWHAHRASVAQSAAAPVGTLFEGSAQASHGTSLPPPGASLQSPSAVTTDATTPRPTVRFPNPSAPSTTAGASGCPPLSGLTQHTGLTPDSIKRSRLIPNPTVWSPPSCLLPEARSSASSRGSTANLAARTLDVDFATTATPGSTSSRLSGTRPPDYHAVSIITPDGRAHAGTMFLDLCRLLAHELPDQSTTLLSARTPSSEYRTHVLSPLGDKSAAQYFPEAHSYLEVVLDRNPLCRVTALVYNQAFFTHAFFQSFLNFRTWLLAPPLFAPNQVTQGCLHPYLLIKALRSQLQTDPTNIQLPTAGITPEDAAHVGALLCNLFTMMDITNHFKKWNFHASVLGHYLLSWSDVPNLPSVRPIWITRQRLVSYRWFDSIRSLLHIVQRWMKPQPFLADLGFTSHSVVSTSGSQEVICVNNNMFNPTSQSTMGYDQELKLWYRGFVDTWHTKVQDCLDPFWESKPPPSHFLPSPGAASLPTTGSASAPPKRARSDAPSRPAKRRKSVADFQCAIPLFDPIEPIQASDDIVKVLKTRLNGNVPRFPMVNDDNGKPAHICLNSCMSAPKNQCCTSECTQRSRNKIPRLHIDIGEPFWQRRPTPHWIPLVDWLKRDDIKTVLRPSETFQQLTSGLW